MINVYDLPNDRRHYDPGGYIIPLIDGCNMYNQWLLIIDIMITDHLGNCPLSSVWSGLCPSLVPPPRRRSSARWISGTTRWRGRAAHISKITLQNQDCETKPDDDQPHGQKCLYHHTGTEGSVTTGHHQYSPPSPSPLSWSPPSSSSSVIFDPPPLSSSSPQLSSLTTSSPPHQASSPSLCSGTHTTPIHRYVDDLTFTFIEGNGWPYTCLVDVRFGPIS